MTTKKAELSDELSKREQRVVVSIAFRLFPLAN